MLKRLSVRDFRCFESAAIDLHPKINILLGRNAQGKTSLIEAACVLVRLQSPRTSSRAELIRFGAPACVVEGVTEEAQLRCAFSASSRRLAVDSSVRGRAADYLASSGRVVWMDHSDMNLLRGGAEHRRRFMDFACSQIDASYLSALRSYERALRSRNFVLKRDASVNWRQVEAYARVMSTHAEVIAARRAELLRAIEPRVQDHHCRLAGPEESVSLEYRQGFDGATLLDALEGLQEEEARVRSTAAGVHRDDIALRLNGLDASSFASEGQQRSFALALKMAQAQLLEHVSGKAPLLLIDDVFGELDCLRRTKLLEGLPAGSQKIITTTQLGWLEDRSIVEDGRVWEVSSGRVVATELGG